MLEPIAHDPGSTATAASVEGTRGRADSRTAITTAHDLRILHPDTLQKSAVAPGGPGLVHRKGGAVAIVRADAAGAPERTAEEVLPAQLDAYRAASTAQERRQCVEELRYTMESLKPSERGQVALEMEHIGARHLWKVLFPGIELRGNSAMDVMVSPRWWSVEKVGSKVVRGASHLFGFYSYLSAFTELSPDGGVSHFKVGVAATKYFAAFWAAKAGAKYLRNMAHESRERQVLLTPKRDAAGIDRTPELTETIDEFLNLISIHDSADRQQCAQALSFAMAKVPRFAEALVEFSVTGDSRVLDQALHIVGSEFGKDNIDIEALLFLFSLVNMGGEMNALLFYAVDEVYNRMGAEASNPNICRAPLSSLLPQDPQMTRAVRCLEDRRLETDDIIELAMKTRGAGEQPAPSLNEPGFHEEVMKELGGRQPLGFTGDAEKAIHLQVYRELEAKSKRTKSATEVFRACLEEAARTQGARTAGDPEMEAQLDVLIARQRALWIERNGASPRDDGAST